ITGAPDFGIANQIGIGRLIVPSGKLGASYRFGMLTDKKPLRMKADRDPKPAQEESLILLTRRKFFEVPYESFPSVSDFREGVVASFHRQRPMGSDDLVGIGEFTIETGKGLREEGQARIVLESVKDGFRGKISHWDSGIEVSSRFRRLNSGIEFAV
ncbi:MAG: hypothetical protein KDM64_18655, partial [Verrucomicrobiae bacterium]|nr:hypothetical protein [Verrucomicrobiae bacterium]